MKLIRFRFLFALVTLFAFSVPAYSGSFDIMGEFSDALDKQDAIGMQSIVTKHKAEVPDTVNRLLNEVVKPGISKEERESRFYLLERLATVYKDVTGDFGLLKSVKKASFESKLNPVVVSPVTDGVHVVETISTEAVKNMFKPDNIVIKSGETVRWVNNDKTTHLLASVMTSIGKGGMFSPHVQPGESWEYTFNTPGEYFYICFIHKIMYGKILVEE